MLLPPPLTYWTSKCLPWERCMTAVCHMVFTTVERHCACKQSCCATCLCGFVCVCVVCAWRQSIYPNLSKLQASRCTCRWNNHDWTNLMCVCIYMCVHELRVVQLIQSQFETFVKLLCTCVCFCVCACLCACFVLFCVCVCVFMHVYLYV